MNLLSTVYHSIYMYNYLVNRQFYEYICFTLIKKKENVKLGSYMWGLNFTMSCSIKIFLNKFKVEISSLPGRLGPSVYTGPKAEDHQVRGPYARDDPCTNYNAV